MTEVSTVHLKNGVTGVGVEGELRDVIEDEQLDDWGTKWVPARTAILQKLMDDGVPRSKWPQSSHWNWRNILEPNLRNSAFRGFCVVAEGVTQGLALMKLDGQGREPSQIGMPLVYLDRLEVAPWNWPYGSRKPWLKGVGIALVAAATQLSGDNGFEGRIGLHSLEQAEGFYRRCRMTNLGPDADYYNLRYFEMTATQADAFLE
jgi:hypothetical protein